jgi:hypothetical protein
LHTVSILCLIVSGQLDQPKKEVNKNKYTELAGQISQGIRFNQINEWRGNYIGKHWSVGRPMASICGNPVETAWQAIKKKE